VITIAVLNRKGGVGKTSTVYHVGGALALAGHRTLTLDLDPQASLTQGHWGPDLTAELDPRSTVAALFAGPWGGCDSLLLTPTALPALWLVRGSGSLEGLTQGDARAAPAEIQGTVRSFLESHRRGFACCLIDCPPHLGLCSWCALLAADAVLCPVNPEDFGAQGISAVNAAVSRARGAGNRRLAGPNFVVSRVDGRRAGHRRFEATLRERYGAAVLDATLPNLADFADAITELAPVGRYAPKSRAAAAAKSVAEELVARLRIPSGRGDAAGDAGGKSPGRRRQASRKGA
jgi:chromosome partitioning protein